MAKDFLVSAYHYPARRGALPRDLNADPFPGVLGCEELKRTAVVAIAGGHRMGYYTVPSFPDANLLAALPPYSWAALPCPCGNFAVARDSACSCSFDTIEEHVRSLSTLHRPQVFARGHMWPAHYDKRPTDFWPDSLAYIRAAEGRPTPHILSKRTGAAELLAHAVDRLGMRDDIKADILAVAGTCARLQGAEFIEACHIAEALQMRVPKSLLA